MGQGQSYPSYGTPPGLRYRALADIAGDAQRELSRESQEAWEYGDGALAKEYSLAAKAQYRAMVGYNAQAASEIFAANNPDYSRNPRVALVKMDLHGLLVNESLTYLKKHLALCKKHGIGRTTIVTGRGRHSDNGVARIKPQVQKILQGEGVRIVGGAERRSSGAFVVEFVRAGEVGGWGN